MQCIAMGLNVKLASKYWCDTFKLNGEELVLKHICVNNAYKAKSICINNAYKMQLYEKRVWKVPILGLIWV